MALVEVLFVVVRGSEEDEHRFPVMAHAKSKPRNRLDKNLSLCMFSQDLFYCQSCPYDKALEL